MRWPLLIVVVAACGGERGAAPVVTVPTSSPASSPVTLTPAALDTPGHTGAPATIDLPAEIACTLRAPKATGIWHTPLRFRAGARPFAVIDDGQDLELTLPTGDASAGATLSLLARTIQLRGVVAAGDVRLYPARAHAVAGCLVPNTHTRLAWASGAQGTATVSFPLSPSMTLRAGTTTRSEWACDDLSIDVVHFNPLDAVGGPGLDKDAVLRPGVRVALAAVAGGAPIADIAPAQDDDPDVTVLAVSGRHSRIAWTSGPALVFGWIASSELLPQMNGGGRGSGVGGGGGATAARDVPRMKCPAAVPLVAEIDGERRTVGTILPDVVIELGASRDDRTDVVVPSASVRVAHGASFSVRAADIAHCVTVR